MAARLLAPIPYALLAAPALTIAALLALARPAPAPYPRTVPAGVPFVERDPGGATLICVSNRAGTPLPPFLGP